MADICTHVGCCYADQLALTVDGAPTYAHR